MMQKLPDKYNISNILNHRTAIAAIDTLASKGHLTAKDKAEMYTIINKKYGFNSCSIFAA
ncbi:MAG: hypothetical protein IKV86_05800 [Clostridia bacterium]|nr:hypothetical protein [Clostridia bacterium]